MVTALDVHEAPDCDLSIEPCCDGCATGMGICTGPGYHEVCLTCNEPTGNRPPRGYPWN